MASHEKYFWSAPRLRWGILDRFDQGSIFEFDEINLLLSSKGSRRHHVRGVGQNVRITGQRDYESEAIPISSPK